MQFSSWGSPCPAHAGVVGHGGPHGARCHEPQPPPGASTVSSGLCRGASGGQASLPVRGFALAVPMCTPSPWLVRLTLRCRSAPARQNGCHHHLCKSLLTLPALSSSLIGLLTSRSNRSALTALLLTRGDREMDAAPFCRSRSVAFLGSLGAGRAGQQQRGEHGPCIWYGEAVAWSNLSTAVQDVSGTSGLRAHLRCPALFQDCFASSKPPLGSQSSCLGCRGDFQLDGGEPCGTELGRLRAGAGELLHIRTHRVCLRGQIRSCWGWGGGGREEELGKGISLLL